MDLWLFLIPWFYTEDGFINLFGFVFIELLFNPGMTTIHMEISILYDAAREISEVFTVHLGQDRNLIAEVKVICFKERFWFREAK